MISKRLHEAQQSVTLNSSFPSDRIGRQLETISKVIASHGCRGADRDVFYVETGFYDTHSDVLPSLQREFESLNNGLRSFVSEMKNLPGNVWDDIAVVISSDFGR